MRVEVRGQLVEAGSPSGKWVLGIKVKLPSLAVKTFPRGTIFRPQMVH